MTEMHSILGIEEDASEMELKNAYTGKRQRYLMEIKSTSAKSRIRLLEDKLAKLETAYKEYVGKASIPGLKEKQKVCGAYETNKESGEATGSKGLPSPDSYSDLRVYPVISVDGRLIKSDLKGKLTFYINGEKQSIEEDGSLCLVKSVNEIRVLHPEFRIFEKSFHVRGTGATPLTIDLVPIKYKFNLTILPKVNFRIFVDGWEHPRSISDKYEFPIFKTKRLTIKANGFEDTFLEVEESINNQNINLTLSRCVGSCDLLMADFPAILRNIQTDEEVKFLTSDNFIFGRGASASIHISKNIDEQNNHEDLFISREHFSIVKEKEKVFLKDHSSNGTFLNGKKVKQCHELESEINYEIQIFHPNKQKALIRKVIMVHKGTNLGIPLFVTVKTDSHTKNLPSHILLFPECRSMRNSLQHQSKWLEKILPLISETKDIDSPCVLHDEASLWQASNINK